MNSFQTHSCGQRGTTPLSRRECLARSGLGLGAVALQALLAGSAHAESGSIPVGRSVPGVLKTPHVPVKAKRVISLFQSGGPSQLETFDYKPLLKEKQGQPLPDSVRQGQRLTGMSGNQAILPVAGSIFGFKQYGQAGAWISDLLPHTAKIADDLCIIRSAYTEAINHDPAITFLQTGSQIAGRPSFGSWLNYGLGSDNENLPAFVVLVTRGKTDQPLYARLWGSGFLPSQHQGVQFRAGSEPVLHLANPDGVTNEDRQRMLSTLASLERARGASGPASSARDRFVEERIQQYEMSFRLQSSVPEAVDLSQETAATLEMYGPDATKPGTFAAHCLLARRLAERGVKFIQLYHQGWDQHGSLPNGIKRQCEETDQPAAALITDLKQRGLLDDTLVLWGGEFGRTNYSQGRLTANDYGRDHHPRCFSMWAAGGGIRAGSVFGETCEWGYNIVSDGVHVHDLHATWMHLLGIDHERLTFRHQGRDFRLTDVHGKVINGLLA